MRPKLAITAGDPAGIGSELIFKALAEDRVHELARLVVVGSREVLAAQSRELGLEVKLVPADTASAPGIIPVADVPLPGIDAWRFGEISQACGEASAAYLHAAVDMVKRGEANGIVTAPLNKESWKAAKVAYPGHTEALGELFGASVETMFVVDQLRIFFLTRHVSLKRAVELVNADRLVELLQRAEAALQSYGFPRPRLAVAALNPHAGEHGLFGDEEQRELEPGVERARARGIDVHGPLPADSVFHQALQGKYDAVIALYHDQGHIASKMHDFYRTVSVTTGLPVVRTSVDHGTAFDIAGQGVAHPTSMIEAIRVAAELAGR